LSYFIQEFKAFKQHATSPLVYIREGSELPNGIDRLFLFLAGPSGVGKETIERIITLNRRSSFITKAVSHTTRPIRTEQRNGQIVETEKQGVDYHFVSENEMDDLQTAGAFLEIPSGQVQGRYATTINSVHLAFEAAKVVLSTAEVTGWDEIKKNLSSTIENLPILTVFCMLTGISFRDYRDEHLRKFRPTTFRDRAAKSAQELEIAALEAEVLILNPYTEVESDMGMDASNALFSLLSIMGLKEEFSETISFERNARG
jgi:guanylate kinase